MNIYLFNVQTSWAITAETEEEAFEMIPGGVEALPDIRLIEQDVMLVDVEKIEED